MDLLQKLADVLTKEAEYRRAMEHKCPICGAEKSDFRMLEPGEHLPGM